MTTPLLPFVRRKKRLAILNHDRSVLQKWRQLKNLLVRSGVPMDGILLHTSPDQRAFYKWVPGKTPVIYIPTQQGSLEHAKTLELNERQEQWAELLMLFHEWGHAVLHPPFPTHWHQWLSEETKQHADPAWMHVGIYAGWLVFNEMFADAWAAGWLLHVSQRDTEAVALLRGLTKMRTYNAKHFDHVDFPCLHPTAPALRRAMAEEWPTQFEEMLQYAVTIADECFVNWLHRAQRPGMQICQSSMMHLLDLEKNWWDGRASMTIRGRSWRCPSLAPNIHSWERLNDLFLRNPSHPLFSFEGVQKCLRWGTGIPKAQHGFQGS